MTLAPAETSRLQYRTIHRLTEKSAVISFYTCYHRLQQDHDFSSGSKCRGGIPVSSIIFLFYFEHPSPPVQQYETCSRFKDTTLHFYQRRQNYRCNVFRFPASHHCEEEEEKKRKERRISVSVPLLASVLDTLKTHSLPTSPLH